MTTKSLTITEAAARLGMSRQGVRKLVLANILRHEDRVGARGMYLIDADEVERLRKARAENESAAS